MEKKAHVSWPTDAKVGLGEAPSNGGEVDVKLSRQKLALLETRLRSLGCVMVAFSGGVDSAFLAKVAHEVLGENALMVTAFSETFPPAERERVLALVHKHGFRHRIVERSELNVTGFVQNGPDRCYHCKLDLFTRLREIAQTENIPHILDGTTAEDVRDYRPGRRAVAETQVLSPLWEADLHKSEIRLCSKIFGLDTWDQPASPCLASRIPYGENVTREKLHQIERAENYLHSLGLRECRVRHHGVLARIEVASEAWAFLTAQHRESLVAEFHALGFTYVTLDLAGFRSGSLNEVLTPAQKAEP
ncbi:MAG: ATP-dependent sacrificial sulfur transferase LarE [Candidatus Firestonebacteria bacterium]|nr:ATP-dependent sacrificial sulfur transferase LarE [Candidatus Firestonebacteria bacterium]